VQIPERILNADGRSYTIIERYGVVRCVERRREKLVVNCGGATRSIDMQEALVTGEDGNEWHIFTGASFLVEPGNKVRVSFAALEGGAPHAGCVKNFDTGTTWRWNMNPLLPDFRWFFGVIAGILFIWLGMWSPAGEPSREPIPHVFAVGVAFVLVGVTSRTFRRWRLRSTLWAEMEAGEAGLGAVYVARKAETFARR
jgi:hypothetical protein